MSGLGLEIRLDLPAIDAQLDGLADIDLAGLLEVAGAKVESQVKRRIESEKTGPDGEAWPAWSDRYARTRHDNQSPLVAEGDLHDSIEAKQAGDAVEVGTNLVYGAIHQFGGKAGRKLAASIPARPYLGLSAENAADLEAMVSDWINEQLGRA